MTNIKTIKGVTLLQQLCGTLCRNVTGKFQKSKYATAGLEISHLYSTRMSIR